MPNGTSAEIMTWILRRQSVRGLQAPFSLAELSPGHEGLVAAFRWGNSLDPAHVRRILHRSTLGEMVDGKYYPDRTVFGVAFIFFCTEVAQRFATQHKLWPIIFQALPPQLQPVLFNDRYPKPEVQLAIREAVAFLGLRNVLSETFERLDGEGLEEGQQYYLTIFLQFGFSEPGFDLRLPAWLRGHPTWDAIQRLRGIKRGQESPSFKQLWETLLRLGRDNIAEDEARRRLAENPWVVPEWIDRLVERAKESAHTFGESAGEEDGKTRSFISLHAWRWGPAQDPLIVCTLEHLHQLELDGDTFDIVVGDRRVGRLLFDGSDWVLAKGATENALPTEFEFEVPGPFTPTITFEFVDPNGRVGYAQSLRLWETASPVNVIHILPNGSAEIIDPESPLHPLEEYLLIVAHDLDILPPPTAKHWLDGRRYCLLRLASEWDSQLIVRQGNAVLWQPRIVGTRLPNNDIRDRVQAFVPTPRAEQRYLDVVIEHPSGATIKYVWSQGQEAWDLSTSDNGTTTRCKMNRNVIAELCAIDLYIGFDHQGLPMRTVHRRCDLELEGVYRNSSEQLAQLGDDPMWLHDLARGVYRFRFKTRQGSEPYIFEGRRPVARLLDATSNTDQRYLGLGAALRLDNRVFNPVAGTAPVVRTVLGGGMLNPSILPGLSQDLRSVRVALSRSYPPLTSEYVLLVWTQDHRLVVLDNLQTTVEGDQRVCTGHNESEIRSVRAVSLLFRGTCVGTTWSPDWCLGLTDLVSDPDIVNRTAQILRWMRLPILHPDARDSVRDFALRQQPVELGQLDEDALTQADDPDPVEGTPLDMESDAGAKGRHIAAVLRGWANEIDLPTDTRGIQCLEARAGNEGVVDQGMRWLVAVRELLATWCPQHYEEAAQLLEGLSDDLDDPVGSAAEQLVLIDSLLMWRVLNRFSSGNLHAAQANKIYGQVRRRILRLPLNTPEDYVQQAAASLHARCAADIARVLGQDEPDLAFVDGVLVAARKLAAGDRLPVFDQRNVEVFNEFAPGRHLIAQHLLTLGQDGG
jgi:hypothetical protein